MKKNHTEQFKKLSHRQIRAAKIRGLRPIKIAGNTNPDRAIEVGDRYLGVFFKKRAKHRRGISLGNLPDLPELIEPPAPLPKDITPSPR